MNQVPVNIDQAITFSVLMDQMVRPQFVVKCLPAHRQALYKLACTLPVFRLVNQAGNAGVDADESTPPLQGPEKMMVTDLSLQIIPARSRRRPEKGKYFLEMD